MCVCVYVCVCGCMCVCVHVCVCVCMRVHVYVCVYVCVYREMYFLTPLTLLLTVHGNLTRPDPLLCKGLACETSLR